MKKLNDDEILNNTKVYDDYHREHKMDDGWLPGNKNENFHLLTRLVELTGIPFSGSTCLDVGCGTGDLSLFLRKLGIKKYLGVDIYEPSIKKARIKYPDETFIHDDFLAATIRRKFDYAFCSGGLTIKLPERDNYTFLQASIEKMWKLTRIGIAFNILTDDDDDPDEDLFFYSQTKVEAICRQIIGKDAYVISEKTQGVHQIHVYLYRTTRQIK